MANADIGATATAEVSPANAMTCVKPFTIPDKWIEKQTPPWDGDDTYDAFDNKGVPLANPDVYIPATQPGYTGYNQEAIADSGCLRAATGNNITVSFYFSLAMGKPASPAAPYTTGTSRTATRRSTYWGDPLTQEPGAMNGPTISGAEALIAKDSRDWDTRQERSRGQRSGAEPRVFPIPLYDPIVYDRASATAEPRTSSPPTGSASFSNTSRATASRAGSSRSPVSATQESASTECLLNDPRGSIRRGESRTAGGPSPLSNRTGSD